MRLCVFTPCASVVKFFAICKSLLECCRKNSWNGTEHEKEKTPATASKIIYAEPPKKLTSTLLKSTLTEHGGLKLNPLFGTIPISLSLPQKKKKKKQLTQEEIIQLLDQQKDDIIQQKEHYYKQTEINKKIRSYNRLHELFIEFDKTYSLLKGKDVKYNIIDILEIQKEFNDIYKKIIEEEEYQVETPEHISDLTTTPSPTSLSISPLSTSRTEIAKGPIILRFAFSETPSSTNLINYKVIRKYPNDVLKFMHCREIKQMNEQFQDYFNKFSEFNRYKNHKFNILI